MQRMFTDYAGASVALLSNDEHIDALINLFASIALEESWQPGADLATFRDRSVYLAGLVNEQIVGGIQLVPGRSGESLPCAELWPELNLQSNVNIGHVVILAVAQEYRVASGLFRLLSLGLWRECISRGITDLWLEATPRSVKLYRRLGWPLCLEGPLREHWSEPCYLCRLSVAEAEAGVREQAKRSSLWQRIVDIADRLD